MTNNTNDKSTLPITHEDVEQYRLHSRNEIVGKLRTLARSRTLATVFFDHGSKSLITTIIEVLPDKDLLVFDYGNDETINNRLIQTDSVVIKTQHDGVTCQFTTHSIKKAKFQGQAVFACVIPENIIWLQRRETYRARLPMGSSASCTLTKQDGSVVTYKILDISTTGIAFHDEITDTEFERGKKFNACQVKLEDHGTGVINLEVRNILPINKDNPKLGRRIGCLVLSITTDIDAMIQRFIHHIETQRRRVDEE